MSGGFLILSSDINYLIRFFQLVIWLGFLRLRSSNFCRSQAPYSSSFRVFHWVSQLVLFRQVLIFLLCLPTITVLTGSDLIPDLSSLRVFLEFVPTVDSFFIFPYIVRTRSVIISSIDRSLKLIDLGCSLKTSLGLDL